MKKKKKPKVFLDTNVLLKAFLSYRKFVKEEMEFTKMPIFLIDEETEKYTFEKCIYEAYLAFRGIGGKKPDEGRGDWANRFLKSLTDPKPISTLLSKYHSNDKENTFFWINNIDGLVIRPVEEDLKLIGVRDKEKYKKTHQTLIELKEQRELFLSLCNEFNDMLQMFSVKELTYIEIFGTIKENEELISFTTPSNLDYFVKSTAIPSEDFEIVYSAERIGADIFVTDDKKLITCARSLGLNTFLSPFSFCTSEKYLEKKAHYLEKIS